MQQVCELQPATDIIRNESEHKNYGGIRRLWYFFGMIAVSVFSEVCNVAAEGEPAVVLQGMAVAYVLVFVLVVNRLRNIGMSAWYSLLILIPIVNIYIGIKCLVCPKGYEETKTLDTAGRVIGGIVIGLVVLGVVGLYFAAFGS